MRWRGTATEQQLQQKDESTPSAPATNTNMPAHVDDGNDNVVPIVDDEGDGSASPSSSGAAMIQQEGPSYDAGNSLQPSSQQSSVQQPQQHQPKTGSSSSPTSKSSRNNRKSNKNNKKSNSTTTGSNDITDDGGESAVPVPSDYDDDEDEGRPNDHMTPSTAATAAGNNLIAGALAQQQQQLPSFAGPASNALIPSSSAMTTPSSLVDPGTGGILGGVTIPPGATTTADLSAALQQQQQQLQLQLQLQQQLQNLTPEEQQRQWDELQRCIAEHPQLLSSLTMNANMAATLVGTGGDDSDAALANAATTSADGGGSSSVHHEHHHHHMDYDDGVVGIGDYDNDYDDDYDDDDYDDDTVDEDDLGDELGHHHHLPPGGDATTNSSLLSPSPAVWQPQTTQSTCEFTHTILEYSKKRESGCKKAEYSATTTDQLGNRWRLIVYVNGNGRASNHHLSLFLQVADADDLPFGWKKAVSYVLTLEHPSGASLSYAKRNPDKTFKLCPKAIDWGWSQFITSDRIQQEGFVLNDSLTVRASVTVKSSSVSIDAEDAELYLKCAVEEGNPQAVTLCLAQGASVNCKFKDDLYTPLHTACSSSGATNGSMQVLELLLLRGADGNACNKWRETPLLIAANNGHRSAVEALLKHGADPSLCSEAGWSALTFAAHKGYDDIVALLLRAEAPVNCRVTEDSSTPLHKACAGSKQGHLVAVKQLLDGGADVHALNKWRETPLLTAANHGQSGAVDALLKAGADPCKCTDTGWSPLSIAAYKGHDDVVLLLLEEGAPTEEADPTLSALLQAATKGLPETVELLLRHGADHTVTTKKGDTALSILVEQNLIDAAVEMVTEYKASIPRCSRDRKKVQRARLLINLKIKQQQRDGDVRRNDADSSDGDNSILDNLSDDETDDDEPKKSAQHDIASASGSPQNSNANGQNGKRKGKGGKKKKKGRGKSASAEEQAKAAEEALLLELEQEEDKARKEVQEANKKSAKKRKKKERERQQRQKEEQERAAREAEEASKRDRIQKEKDEAARKDREKRAKAQRELEAAERERLLAMQKEKDKKAAQAKQRQAAAVTAAERNKQKPGVRKQMLQQQAQPQSQQQTKPKATIKNQSQRMIPPAQPIVRAARSEGSAIPRRSGHASNAAPSPAPAAFPPLNSVKNRGWETANVSSNGQGKKSSSSQASAPAAPIGLMPLSRSNASSAAVSRPSPKPSPYTERSVVSEPDAFPTLGSASPRSIRREPRSISVENVPGPASSSGGSRHFPSSSSTASAGSNSSSGTASYTIEPPAVALFRREKLSELLEYVLTSPVNSLRPLSETMLKNAVHKWSIRAMHESYNHLDPLIPSWTDLDQLTAYFQRQFISGSRQGMSVGSPMINMEALREAGSTLASLCQNAAKDVVEFRRQLEAQVRRDWTDESIGVRASETSPGISGGKPMVVIDWARRSQVYLTTSEFQKLRSRFSGPSNRFLSSIFVVKVRYDAANTLTVADSDMYLGLLPETKTTLNQVAGVTAELWSGPFLVDENNVFWGRFVDIDPAFGGQYPFSKEGNEAELLMAKHGGSVSVVLPVDNMISSRYVRHIVDLLRLADNEGSALSFFVLARSGCFQDRHGPSTDSLYLLDARLGETGYVRRASVLPAGKHSFCSDGVGEDVHPSRTASLLALLQNEAGASRFAVSDSGMYDIARSLDPSAPPLPTYDAPLSVSADEFSTGGSFLEGITSSISPTIPQTTMVQDFSAIGGTTIGSAFSPPTAVRSLRTGSSSRRGRLFDLVDDDDDGEDTGVDVVSGMLNNLDVGLFQNSDIDIEAISLMGLPSSSSNPTHGNSRNTSHFG